MIRRPASRFLLCAPLTAACLIGLPGCLRKQSGANVKSQLPSLEALAEEGDTMVLSLVEPEALALFDKAWTGLEDSKKTWAQFEANGVIKPARNARPSTLSKHLFDALNFTVEAGASVSKGEGGYFRHDMYEIVASFGKTKVFGKDGAVAVPFQFKKGGKIHTARLFPTQAQADAATALGLDAIPLDAERAARLPAGSYFGIPVELKLTTNVTGRLLQRTWRDAADLLPFLEGSLTGGLSGAHEGTLLAQGNFDIHVMRMDGQKVRVKITASDASSVGGTVNIQSQNVARFVFMPSTRLPKLRSAKAISLGRNMFELAGLGLDRARKTLHITQILSPLVGRMVAKDKVGQDPQGADRPLHPRARQVLEWATQLREGVETIDEVRIKTASRILERLKAKNPSGWSEKYQKIRALTNKAFDAAGTVRIQGRAGFDVDAMADYIFDLSDPEARVAFDHLVSGRVMLQTRGKLLPPFDLDDALYSDASLAEGLAFEDQGKEQKRVERVSRLAREAREASRAMSFHALGFKRAMGGSWKDTRIEIVDGEARRTGYMSRTWQFDSSLDMGRDGDRELKFGGMIAPSARSFEVSGDGAYAFGWQRTFLRSHRDGAGVVSPKRYEEAIHHFLNVLGPLADGLRVPELYAGEFPGKITAKLNVVFTQQAVDALFDGRRTDEAMMWEALGRMARTYDTRFGLPTKWDFNAPNLFAPQSLVGKYRIPAMCVQGQPTNVDRPAAGGKVDASCLAMTQSWGACYCHFANNFLVGRILQLQSLAEGAGQSKERLEFLQELFSFKTGANAFGGDVMTRFLAELTTLRAGRLGTAPKDAFKDIVVDISIANADDDSTAANPSIQHGSDATGTLVRLLGTQFW